MTPLIVLGVLRARRGDPDPWGPLDEAEAIAAQTRAVPNRRAARLRARRGRLCSAATPTGLAPPWRRTTPAALADRWVAGELAAWRARLGLPPVETGALPEPFALELEATARRAAEFWDGRGRRAGTRP